MQNIWEEYGGAVCYMLFFLGLFVFYGTVLEAVSAY